jgi:formate-dependent nitrite reductase cytochrome c552 subunit
MAMFKRLMAFAGIAALGLGLAACSRNITRVEQVVAGPQGCFECHSDTSTFLVAAAQQWANSKHASGGTLNENDGACKGCHTSEGFLAVASGTTIADVVENPTSIHCFTCHAPHTNGDFSTRPTTVAQKTLMNGVTYNLNAGNLCLACHRSRRNVGTYVVALTMTTRFGPHHGPQGDMLIGSNGYEYAGYTYEQGSHALATTTDGKDGCLECHMKTTSQNVVGGHSFNMATADDAIINIGGCAKCHAGIADFDWDGVQTEISGLISDLETLLVNAGFITMNGEAAVPNAVAVTADQAGAVYNLLLAKEDRSEGVHNPNYIRGLLQSSIDFMNTPGLTATAAQRAMSASKGRR